MTITDIVNARGSLCLDNVRRDDTLALQAALYAAGYRIGVDGAFGPGTQQAVKKLQTQFNLTSDGVVGLKTAAILDLPHATVVVTATPLVAPAPANPSIQTPHDDTASLIAFYGDPTGNLDSWKAKNVTTVTCPWTLYYEGVKWPHPIQFHVKVAANLKQALDTIWTAAGQDDKSPLLNHVRNFSGSGELRAVRGSSRISTHGFWAAIDFDAERLPLAHGVPASEMPQEVVDAFIAAGFFWGGNYLGRKDPMHFQMAHE